MLGRPGNLIVIGVAIAAFSLATGLPAAAREIPATGSLERLERRMSSLQSELDEAAATIDRLQSEAAVVRNRITTLRRRRAVLENRSSRLRARLAERAGELYRSGSGELLEVLLSSQSFRELTEKAELLVHASAEDNAMFMRYARARAALAGLAEELIERRRDLNGTTADLRGVAERLRERLRSVAGEVEDVKVKLAAQRARRRAKRSRAAETASATGVPPASLRPPATSIGPRTCPVAGPVSFVDSWGAPRAGHTHVGVDLLADYGTPVVAIVSGTVTYAGYDGSGGNMIFLSGEDGNDYWYMHNQANLVTGGKVVRGEQIATVGDTGNAVGIPHVHFEYHPGGGGPVNPYPVVAPIC
ncbi:MAG: peptidoglycan DD-metalloendopeptidase family protein [Actinomycetota bacterium]|nr:peptidoglycan DD-metalloendopeptidase family protein [Actinomycetota bacterium]